MQAMSLLLCQTASSLGGMLVAEPAASQTASNFQLTGDLAVAGDGAARPAEGETEERQRPREPLERPFQVFVRGERTATFSCSSPSLVRVADVLNFVGEPDDDSCLVYAGKPLAPSSLLFPLFSPSSLFCRPQQRRS